MEEMEAVNVRLALVRRHLEPREAADRAQLRDALLQRVEDWKTCCGPTQSLLGRCCTTYSTGRSIFVQTSPPSTQGWRPTTSAAWRASGARICSTRRSSAR
jgi:hypothetical protein